MTVTPITHTGNSSKFNVQTKNGNFDIALSFTLRSKIWELPDAQAELSLANELAEAIVSRHDPKLPFKKIYIFAEHTALPTAEETVKHIRKYGFSQ